MSKGHDRTVYRRADGKWVNKRNDNTSASSIHDTQRAAIDSARQQLQGSGGGELTRKSYHVVPALRGGWSVRKEGAHRATRHFETKESAVQWAQKISKDHETELYIHDKDGRVSDRRSYAKDPYPPKDW